MVKFVVKQKNIDLDEEDINNMMTRVLGKESSVAKLHLSASTHDPYYEYVYMVENCLVGLRNVFNLHLKLLCLVLLKEWVYDTNQLNKQMIKETIYTSHLGQSS